MQNKNKNYAKGKQIITIQNKNHSQCSMPLVTFQEQMYKTVRVLKTSKACNCNLINVKVQSQHFMKVKHI